jgi:hypothetical protein
MDRILFRFDTSAQPEQAFSTAHIFFDQFYWLRIQCRRFCLARRSHERLHNSGASHWNPNGIKTLRYLNPNYSTRYHRRDFDDTINGGIAAFLSDRCLVFGTCPPCKQRTRWQPLKDQGEIMCANGGMLSARKYPARFFQHDEGCIGPLVTRSGELCSL